MPLPPDLSKGYDHSRSPEDYKVPLSLYLIGLGFVVSIGLVIAGLFF